MNVRGTAPPAWLRDRLVDALDRLGTYPSAADDRRAREAVAARHGREPDEVLILNGAAEGLRAAPGAAATARRPAAPVVHRARGGRCGTRTCPSTASCDGDRSPTTPIWSSSATPPTRPRSCTPAAADRAARPARPGAGGRRGVHGRGARRARVAGRRTDLPGLLVLRSLTKTWALPGLRAGYALGAPDLLRRLAKHRPHWPVGTLALEAVTACSEPHAVDEAEREADRAGRGTGNGSPHG